MEINQKIREYIDNEEDINYLIHFIKNCRNGIRNDKMLLFVGSGNNGKTSLSQYIKSQITDLTNLFITFDISNTDDDMIRYIKSVKPKCNFITETNNINDIENDLSQYKIIHFNKNF